MPQPLSASVSVTRLMSSVVNAALSPYVAFLGHLVDEGRITRKERDDVAAKVIAEMRHLSDLIASDPASPGDEA